MIVLAEGPRPFNRVSESGRLSSSVELIEFGVSYNVVKFSSSFLERKSNEGKNQDIEGPLLAELPILFSAWIQ